MMSFLLIASLGMSPDVGGFQRPSAERPVLLDLPPVATPAGPSFVIVDRPESVHDGHDSRWKSGVQIVDRPEPATKGPDKVLPQIRYLHNGVEIDAQEFFRRLNQRR
ncbi:hypothetical protein BH23PLA1_BH23PLA1_20720 [soil metagenome]